MLDALRLFRFKSVIYESHLSACDLLVHLVTEIRISLPHILLGIAVYLRKGVYHDCKFSDLVMLQ